MTGADLHDIRLARRRQPIPIPACATKIIGMLGGDSAVPGTMVNVKFRLRRIKASVEVFLCVPGFSWSLSHMENRWPSSFVEARAWVAAYGAGYGQTFDEVVKERQKAATGDDRKLLKAGGCREAWLSSDVPALWAGAQVRCQHAGAYCGQDGYCHFGTCDMEMNPDTE
ncbi:MAG: hypothetical protein ACOH2T_29195 [Pseudomonas sp.]